MSLNCSGPVEAAATLAELVPAETADVLNLSSKPFMLATTSLRLQPALNFKRSRTSASTACSASLPTIAAVAAATAGIDSVDELVNAAQIIFSTCPAFE